MGHLRGPEALRQRRHGNDEWHGNCRIAVQDAAAGGGLSLADAYKLANFDDLMAGKSASAKQAALNNMNGTAHLNQTDGVTDNNDNEVEIPTNELEQWKRAFPHASAKELRKKYNNAIRS